MNKDEFIRGVKSGFPIMLGYFAVSFTFGIAAVTSGFSWWQAVIISALTVTSAGQLSGIQTMMHPGLYLDMLISQITINIRYSFMSIALSQKTDKNFTKLKKILLATFITDENFAVAISNDSVSASYFAGVGLTAHVGWISGTLFGSVLGSVLPSRMIIALSVGLYAMFVAIVTPEMKKSRAVIFTVVLSIIISVIMYYVPFFSEHISSGIRVTISAVIASVISAVFFTLPDEEDL